MNNQIIRYFLLIILTFLISYLILPFGDYSGGLAHAILTVFLIGIFIIIVIIFFILDIIKISGNQRKLGFISIVFLLIFILINYFVFNTKGEKFWTETTLIGKIETMYLRDGELTLYKNQSFSARVLYADYSCTYQGEYQINDSILILHKENLTNLTDSLFTIEYKLKLDESRLIPMQSGFGIIEIKN